MIAMRSAAMPARSSDATTCCTRLSADVSHGSFFSIGERKEYGYQEFAAACGARYAMSVVRSSPASASMSSAEAPLP
jgi:hypothetical protein